MSLRLFPCFIIAFVLSTNFCLAQKLSPRYMNWQQDSSGLRYIIVRQGNAVHPDTNSYVQVNYVALDAITPIDTSAIRETENVHHFLLDKVIVGFAMGVCMLGEGGEGYFWMPPHLAYQYTEVTEYRGQSFLFYVKLIARLETNQLTLSDSKLNALLFNETTIKSSTKIFGIPDSTSNNWISANLGFTCIRSFITNHYYDSLNCELRFYSINKDQKNKKKLSMITLDAKSNVRINDSLRLADFNMGDIPRIFGSIGDRSATDETKHEIYWRYPLVLNGQKVIGEFVFAESGELVRLCITRDRDSK